MLRSLPMLLLMGCPAPLEEAPGVCALPRATPPVCGSSGGQGERLIAGPNESAYDDELATKAARIDRQATLLNSWDTDAAGPITLLDVADRDAVEAWLDSEEPIDQLSIDLETEVHWGKAPGAFTGMAIAADAYRYGALRDSGADCEQVDAARERLHDSLDVLHMAIEVTGVDGLIARALATDALPPYDEEELTPLFDGIGTPLPYEKNNGTWRDDESQLYRDMVWEDSASRDQYIGWVVGMAASWEVTRGDDGFDDELSLRLQRDAREMLAVLRTVQEEGFDLEIRDPDGRRTLHGILHEESIDDIYLPGANNPLNPVMALGIVTALTRIADDHELDLWLQAELLEQRRLHELVRDHVEANDVGVATNHSNLAMAWNGAWLVQRYHCDEHVRGAVTDGMEQLYSPTGQALYDLVRTTQQGEVTAWETRWEPADNALLAPVSQTLATYRASLWNDPLVNCDADEIDAGTCTLEDGSEVELLGFVGRGDKLVASTPVPMAVRPPSTYHWRSNPYEVNGDGGNGMTLHAGSDFRFVYWAGRYVRR